MWVAATVFLGLLVPTDAAAPRGAYIHVPFCRRRCFYCNFPIVVVGDRPSSQEQQGEAYTALLLREMDLTLPAVYGHPPANDAAPLPLASVYFGGGTPSLLPISCLRAVLSRLGPLVRAGDTEVTLEMDPGTFTAATLLELEDAGVTRLSLGIQSFDDTILRACGRAHTAADAWRAIDTIHASPTRFKDNFSIDLISSLPHLTLPLWEDTLRHAVRTGCSHVSVYDLQVEDKTAFGRWYAPGVFPLPSDADSAAMYRLAANVLGNGDGGGGGGGFEHYEVSNYAKSGKRSRHNQLYWRCEPTLGFGMGAASFLDHRRFTRPAKLSEYTAWLDRLAADGLGAATVQDEDEDDEEGEDHDDDAGATAASASVSVAVVAPAVTGKADILEVVMLALRTADGLCLGRLRDDYGDGAEAQVLAAVAPFADRGLVTVADGTVRLVDPDGFLVSNDIISSVFVELTA